MSGKPTDEVILRNAKLSAEYRKPAFVRINQEMNAYWFDWSAYNADGSRGLLPPRTTETCGAG